MVSHVYVVVLQHKVTGEYALRTCATRAMAEAVKADVERTIPNMHHYSLVVHKGKLERLGR